MKRLITISVICIALSLRVSAQVIILSENFNFYNAEDSTVPTGWTFSAHGIYPSTSFSGPSGPNSFQFGKDSVEVISPVFSKADSLSFWIKGTSTISVLNRLLVLGTSGSNTWDTITDMDSLPKSGKIISLSLKSSYAQLKFLFRKTSGNLALDDVVIKANSPTGIAPFPAKEIVFILENSILQIHSSRPNETTDFFLFNYNGKMLFRRQMQGSWSVDLSTLETGMYIAGARVGGKKFTKKISIRN